MAPFRLRRTVFLILEKDEFAIRVSVYPYLTLVGLKICTIALIAALIAL